MGVPCAVMPRCAPLVAGPEERVLVVEHQLEDGGECRFEVGGVGQLELQRLGRAQVVEAGDRLVDGLPQPRVLADQGLRVQPVRPGVLCLLAQEGLGLRSRFRVGDKRLGLPYLSDDELLERDRKHADRVGHVREVGVGRLPLERDVPAEVEGHSPDLELGHQITSLRGRGALRDQGRADSPGQPAAQDLAVGGPAGPGTDEERQQQPQHELGQLVEGGVVVAE